MAKQTINIGTTANDGTGDTARDAFDICNDNFTELYTGSAIAEGAAILSTGPVTDGYVLTADGAGGAAWEAAASGTPEGTAILSTGEVGGSKFLREDGDGTSSWQAIPAPEGTSVLSTGPVTDGYVLTADGAGGAAWEAASGGGGTPGGSSGDIQYNNAGSFDGSYLKQGTNRIEQYNSTNAQRFYLFNTRTDASNYEAAHFAWVSNVLNIGTEAAGTGTLRDIKFTTDDAISFWLDSSEKFRMTNTYFGSVASGGGLILQAAASATSPAFIPDGGDADTGIGQAGSDQLSLIAGGVEVLRAVEDTGNAIQLPTGQTVAGLPTTPAAGMIARVTDASSPAVGSTVTGGAAAAALVWYNGSNWTVIGV